MDEIAVFPPGSLRERLDAATRRARQSGALEPIETDCYFSEDDGIRFIIRRVIHRTRKPVPQVSGYSDPTAANPFLPFDRQLYVADASTTHVCVLNKFNVVDNHLLILTREFEHQESPLTQQDFVAWWKCLVEFDALGFYNSGVVAGASQPHKHLQLVPLPMADGVKAIPLSVKLRNHRPRPGTVDSVAEIPYRHLITFFDDSAARGSHRAARECHQIYGEMLRRFGMDSTVPGNGRLMHPYNLLVTRRWMLMVPRKRECFESISLNSQAFAGTFLVHTARQHEALAAARPTVALQHVAGRDPMN